MHDKEIEELRGVLGRMGFKETDSGTTDTDVSVVGEKDGKYLKVWYNIKKSLYGFDMWGGGSKSYPTLLGCEMNLKTYLWVNMEFIPAAKTIADKFGVLMGIETLYATFRGSEGHFVASFRVLGSEGYMVEVENSGDGFAVRLVEFNPDKSKCRVVSTVNYEGGGVCWTWDVVADLLFRRYGTDAVKMLDEQGSFSVMFQGEAEPCNVRMVVNGCTLGWEHNGKVYWLDNPMDLDELYEVIHAGDGQDSGCEESMGGLMVVEPEPEPESEPESAGQGIGSDAGVADEPGQTGKLNSSCALDGGIPGKADMAVGNSVADAGVGAVPYMISKVVDFKTSELLGIHILADGVLYRVSLGVVRDMGIPMDRLYFVDYVSQRNGVFLSDLECARKCFSKDVSGDEGFCRDLLDRLFG